MSYSIREPADFEAFRPAFGESLAGKPPTTYVIPLCDPRRDEVPYMNLVEVLHKGSIIHRHTHQRAYESFFVLRGHGHLEVGDARLVMRPGGTYTVMPGVRHAIWNDDDERLYLMITLVPDEGFADAVYAGERVELDDEDRATLCGIRPC